MRIELTPKRVTRHDGMYIITLARSLASAHEEKTQLKI